MKIFKSDISHSELKDEHEKDVYNSGFNNGIATGFIICIVFLLLIGIDGTIH